MESIGRIIQQMVIESGDNVADIQHFLTVWAYAMAIGKEEKLAEEMQYILEAAAVVHDIACPVLREKYGHCEGKMQEKEGPALARKFLGQFDLSQYQTDRIAFLVAHHHTYENVDGMDYRILLEADYIVNAEEKRYSLSSIRSNFDMVFKTESGKRLAMNIFDIG